MVPRVIAWHRSEQMVDTGITGRAFVGMCSQKSCRAPPVTGRPCQGEHSICRHYSGTAGAAVRFYGTIENTPAQPT